MLFDFSLFFVQFGQHVNNLPSFIFAAIKANRVGQSLSSAFFAHHKLRRFQRMMRPSVPRMRTGASHSYYHIICNYTRLSVLRKTPDFFAKNFKARLSHIFAIGIICDSCDIYATFIKTLRRFRKRSSGGLRRSRV